jgi:hypothetical protein
MRCDMRDKEWLTHKAIPAYRILHIASDRINPICLNTFSHEIVTLWVSNSFTSRLASRLVSSRLASRLVSSRLVSSRLANKSKILVRVNRPLHNLD